MFVLYFKDVKASFQEQRFEFEGISSKYMDCSKGNKRQYLGLEAKMDKCKTTLFSQSFEVPCIKVPLFF